MKILGFYSSILVYFLLFVSESSSSNPIEAFKGQNSKIIIEPKLSIVATPPLLEKSGDYVLVSFDGVSHPDGKDFIAVFSPSTVNPLLTAPVKYQWANKSSGFIEKGSGALSFKMINMHADYLFVFCRNGTDHPIISGISNVVDFSNNNEPMQGHLYLTNNPSEMGISWASGGSQEQYVMWGYTSANLSDGISQSNSFTYQSSDLCGKPATGYGWRDPGYLQNAVMTDLPLNTKIYYQFGNNNESGWSSVRDFTTAGPLGKSNGITIVAYGDAGHGEDDHSREYDEQQHSLNTTKNVEDLVKKGDIDFVLHIGDLAYARGYSAQWDHYMAQIEPIASRAPYMTCTGNHERDFPHSGSFYVGTDSGGECGKPYEMRFPMPTTSHQIQWYSFDYGNVHFVLISTENDFVEGSDQWNWLQNDLSNVDREITPWIVLGGHRPMYCDSIANSTMKNNSDAAVSALLQEAFDELFFKYSVDVALWGHNHSYQRMCPIVSGTCADGGTVHVVIGMGGHSLQRTFSHHTPDYVVYESDKSYGYSIIETTDKDLHFKFYNNKDTSTPEDEFVLHR